MDLSLVPLDQLISALQDRGECSVVLIYRSDRSGAQTFLTYSGTVLMALGMMEQFKHDLLTGEVDNLEVDGFETI